MFIKKSAIVSFILVNTLNAALAGGAFVDNNNGTVTDLATGLIWQQSDDGITKDQATALTYCDSLSLGGSNNWRLPEVKELSSLIDYAANELRIDRLAFPDTVAAIYWSATENVGDPNNAWSAHFGLGGTGGNDLKQ